MVYSQEQIEELLQHPLGSKDHFRFRCTKCGRCCKNRVDILLSPFDLCRLARTLRVSLPEVLRDYGDLYIGETSKVPLVALKMQKENGRCPFLREDNCCSVQQSKPSVCALYPLGRAASREEPGKVEILYFLQPTACGARDEVHTLEGWIKHFHLEESEEWFSVWQDIVVQLSEHIYRVLPEMSEKSGEEMLIYIAKIMYLRYDPEQPLIPQVKENLAFVIKITDDVERMVELHKSAVTKKNPLRAGSNC